MNAPRWSHSRRAGGWCRILGLVAISATGGLGAAKPPPAAVLPAKAFFGNSDLSEARLSPNGRYIAFLFPHESRMAVGIFDRTTGEAHSVVRGTDESIGEFFWKGNDRIVFLADVRGNEMTFIGSSDLEGRHILRLAESGYGVRIIDPLVRDPTYVGVTTSMVARLNVRNGGLVYQFSENTRAQYLDFVFDNAGVLRLVAKVDRGSVVWLHRPDSGSPFREIARFPLDGIGERWSGLFFGADNRTLYLITREENDRGGLCTYDTTALKRGPILFTPPEGEIDSAVMSYDRSKLYGVAYESDRRYFAWFDPTRAALQRKLENTFPGMACDVVSSSADEQVRLVFVHSDRDPGAYFVLDERAGTLALFKRVRAIDPRVMRPMQPITFPARDGLELHGYLTLPAGAEGQRVPLVIYPHGGPYGIRDSWRFDPDVQFLANRGYAVLQVNYRGSGGYGRAFVQKGRYQWAKAMQDDLTDGVEWAVKRGIADPARVAIYGASYGGYAALMGAALTPDLYRCAVNYVGIADTNRLDIYRRAFVLSSDYDFLSAWIGPTAAARDAISPIHFVDRIRIPTLHAYGRNDPRIEFTQWERLEARLRKLHKPYEVIVEKYQGHGFRDEAQSIHFHEVLERFLSANLAPAGAP